MRANIKKIGLVGPALVLNERTGNLISGHLRLAQLDLLEGSTDYTLDMTVVDWTEKREKQQNVFFNNPWSQGDFDLEALGQLLAADLDSLEDFGLDPVEIQHLFPDDQRFGDLFRELEADMTTMPGAKAALDEIEADKDAEKKKPRREPGEMQAERREYGAILDKANAADFYVIVVCKDGDQCGEVLEALGSHSTDQRYVSAELVLRAVQER